MTSNPPWVSTVLVSAVKRKRDLFSVSRKFPTPVNMEAYRVQRNFVKYLSRKTYRSYISSLSATISSPNRPSLYQFIRTQRPSVSRAPIQCLIDPDGNRQSEAKSIADTLNKQFVSPGLPDDPNWVIPPLHPAPELRAPLLEVFTTTGVVRKQLKRLKSCKSPGKTVFQMKSLNCWCLPCRIPCACSSTCHIVLESSHLRGNLLLLCRYLRKDNAPKLLITGPSPSYQLYPRSVNASSMNLSTTMSPLPSPLHNPASVVATQLLCN